MQELAAGTVWSKLQSEAGPEECNSVDELLEDDLDAEELLMDVDVDDVELDDCIVEMLVRGDMDDEAIP